MTKNMRTDSEDRNSRFISRGNSIIGFIQTVVMFGLCVLVTAFAAIASMPEMVATMAVLSTISGTLGSLWIIERFDLLSSAISRAPRMLRSVSFATATLGVSVLIAIAVSLHYGAWFGFLAHLLVYIAEFSLAIALRFRRK